MIYTIPFELVATGSVAGTWKTIASLIMHATNPGRAAIVAVRLANVEAAPVDLALRCRIMRNLTGASKGTAGSTIAAASIPKKDSLSPDAPFTAGLNYSAEPTYAAVNPLWLWDFNGRASIAESFGGNEIIANVDQLLGLQMTPLTAVARTVSGSIDVAVR